MQCREWGLEFMEGGGRQWQVSGSAFHIIAGQKNTQYSPQERGIDLTVFGHDMWVAAAAG